jgi:hypothetical protein
MFERRSVGRTTISKSALLFFVDQSNVHTCLVKDVTNVGAGVHLSSLNSFSRVFELSFDKFHTIRTCRVIWLQGERAGVAFEN